MTKPSHSRITFRNLYAQSKRLSPTDASAPHAPPLPPGANGARFRPLGAQCRPSDAPDARRYGRRRRPPRPRDATPPSLIEGATPSHRAPRTAYSMCINNNKSECVCVCVFGFFFYIIIIFSMLIWSFVKNVGDHSIVLI